jgi:hypothetical protein
MKKSSDSIESSNDEIIILDELTEINREQI